MTNKVQLKRTTISGRVPTTSDIGIGEIAINHADGSMYIVQTTANTVSGVTQIGTDYTSPTYVGPGQTYTVNANKQALFINDITVDGNVSLSGDLIDAKAKDTTFYGDLGSLPLTTTGNITGNVVSGNTITGPSITSSGNVSAVNGSFSNSFNAGAVYASTGPAAIFGTGVTIHPYPGDINLITDTGAKIILNGQLQQGLEYGEYHSGPWDLGTTYTKPLQLIPNFGNLNVTITASPLGSLTSVYDFFITASANNTSVSWPAGSQITGSYDTTNGASTYARVIVGGGVSSAQVSYISSAGKAFNGNISAPYVSGNVAATNATISGNLKVSGTNVGFYNVTPVTRAAAISTVSNSATGTQLATAINAIIAALQNIGITS